MEEAQYVEIKEHVPAFENYKAEVRLIEQFFEEKNIEIESTTIIFWNHIITLLERVDEDEQNTTEEPVDRMSDEAQKLTDDFKQFLNSHRPFELTGLEHYLLTIYFEQFK